MSFTGVKDDISEGFRGVVVGFACFQISFTVVKEVSQAFQNVSMHFRAFQKVSEGLHRLSAS